MDPAELHFAQLAHHIARLAMQAAVAYEQAQSKLALHEVLTPGRLASAAGVQQSKDTIAALSTLTGQHKQMFMTFMSQASAQLLTAAKELSPERQAAMHESLLQSVRWNLAAQTSIYEGREAWIDAATRLLDLIDENRDLVDCDGGNLLFQSDELLDEFNELVTTIDAVHEREVALQNERQARIMASAATLNAKA